MSLYIHFRNTAKRGIRTFKAKSLSILNGISSSFHNYLWYKLLPQAELTLNILRKYILAPSIYA